MAKRTFLLAAIAAALLLLGFWITVPERSGSDLVAPGAIHWHPRLTIYVNGEQVPIPENIGIGAQYAGTRGYDPQMGMAAMHTHEDLPLIHLEFMRGPVYAEDITLGRFFQIWNKDMRSFGENMRPSDERGSTEASRMNVRMTVNGAPTTEYEGYVMKDGDAIELRYGSE